MGNYFYTQSNENIQEKDEESEEIDKKYEKELINNFKYFNVFWYDPNNSNDFDYFKKYFLNVLFVKGTDLESVQKFFQKEISSDEWIIITPGSKGEELIINLEDNEHINAFFVYCWDTEIHKNWVKKYNKVKCLTSEPDILLENFVEINKNFIFPNFKYNDNYNENDNSENDFLFSFNEIKANNQFALNSIKRELKTFINHKNRIKNQYNKFCVKTIYYLNGDNCLNDFKEPVTDENEILYYYASIYKTINDNDIKEHIKFMKNCVLLSFYFSLYKYLDNLLSYDEVKSIYKKDIDIKEFSKKEARAKVLINKLVDKIMKNESILEQKNDLKEIQKYYINLIFNNIILSKFTEFIKYYQVINFLRDFDFCAKMFIYYNFTKYNNKNHNFFDDLYNSLLNDDRVSSFFGYIGCEEKLKGEELSKNNQRIINDSLLTKDFIVLGNKNFQDKIKAIKSDLNIETMAYLKANEISDYILKKKKNDELNDDIATYFYYLIITLDDIKSQNLEKIILLSAELGVTFMILLYIENENDNLIYKNYISNLEFISIILVYSITDIINYLSVNIDFQFGSSYIELLNSFDIIKPKKGIKQDNKDKEKENQDYQDGCFELAETFDNKIVKNKTIYSFHDEIIYSSISKDIYNIYKEHKALDLFFGQNIKYFGFTLEPETRFLDICFIKRVLYMYCREEIESEKSFYRMINDDLRTKDPSKIDRFIVLLGLIYKLIDNKELASFQGKVYRATKLDENLILKLKPGSTMINITFWSTAKEFGVADNFMKKNSWRNAFIICKTKKTNIDIDYENLNPFDEKEVLILPFTEFKVEKIYFQDKYGKKIYIIELVELGNKSLVNYDIMNIEVINDLSVSLLAKNVIKTKNKNN